MVDERPSCGSCPVCRAALGLVSVQTRGVWYCSPACADGRAPVEGPRPAVPEPWLYARPRRFFGKRRPKELNSASGSDGSPVGS